MDTLILNGSGLTLEALYDVAYRNRPVAIAPEAYERLAHGRQIMSDLSHSGKPIYGFNRGVGWNKDVNIDEAFFEQQNRMIVRSHCLGMAPFSRDVEVRAMMAIRLNNMLIAVQMTASINPLRPTSKTISLRILPAASKAVSHSLTISLDPYKAISENIKSAVFRKAPANPETETLKVLFLTDFSRIL